MYAGIQFFFKAFILECEMLTDRLNIYELNPKTLLRLCKVRLALVGLGLVGVCNLLLGGNFPHAYLLPHVNTRIPFYSSGCTFTRRPPHVHRSHSFLSPQIFSDLQKLNEHTITHLQGI